jgi:hypothetical protein
MSKWVHHVKLAHICLIIFAGAVHEPIFFKLEMDGFSSEDGSNKICHFQSGSQGIGPRTRKKLAKPLEPTSHHCLAIHCKPIDLQVGFWTLFFKFVNS